MRGRGLGTVLLTSECVYSKVLVHRKKKHLTISCGFCYVLFLSSYLLPDSLGLQLKKKEGGVGRRKKKKVRKERNGNENEGVLGSFTDLT